MIVVGGWPGRIVVGLNGRFGARPADFADLGDFPSPLANDVDGGDETTEFVAVVQSLPASGSVVFDDFGGFEHTGAADGSYATAYRLCTWAQGGPVTVRVPDAVITTNFGAGLPFAVTGAGGIASGEAFGLPAAAFERAFAVAGAGGIESGEAFGTPEAAFSAPFVAAGAGGIASGEAFGQAAAVFSFPFALVGAGGIPSGEAFGTAVASFTNGVFTLVAAGGIPSGEAFGEASASFIVDGGPPFGRVVARPVRGRRVYTPPRRG